VANWLTVATPSAYGPAYGQDAEDVATSPDTSIPTFPVDVLDPELIIAQRWPLADTYGGNAERCSFCAMWVAMGLDDQLQSMLASKIEQKVKESGGNMLSLKVWRGYQIPPAVGEFPLPAYTVVMGEAEATASPLAWNAIIIGAFILLGILAVSIVTLNVMNYLASPAGQKVGEGLGKAAEGMGQLASGIGGNIGWIVLAVVAFMVLGAKK